MTVGRTFNLKGYYIFHQNQTPNRHVRTSHKIEPDVYRRELLSCGECEFVAGSKFILKHHVRTNHKLKRFRCSACNKKTFSTRWNLKIHMRAVHKVDVDVSSIVEDSKMDEEEAGMVENDSKVVKNPPKRARKASKRAKNKAKLLKEDSKMEKNDYEANNMDMDISHVPTVKIKEEVTDAQTSTSNKRGIFGNVAFLSEDGKECARMTETHLRRQQISQLLEREVPPWKIAQV